MLVIVEGMQSSYEHATPHRGSLSEMYVCMGGYGLRMHKFVLMLNLFAAQVSQKTAALQFNFTISAEVM